MLSQRIRPQASRKAGQLRPTPLRAANIAGLTKTSLQDQFTHSRAPPHLP